MANFAALLQTIAGNIYTNGEGDINAEVLKSVLNAMVEGLGQAGYIFKGVAQPSTNPGTPDTNVFYLAGVGTFTNFGGTTVNKGHIGVFAYDGSWNYQVLMTGAWFESEVYPGDDALEVTFYDTDVPGYNEGTTIKINADVSEIANSKLEAISTWWAAQKERQINGLRGFTITISSLGMSPQSLGMFTGIEAGQFIDSITNASQLIFGTEGGETFTVDASACPYKAPAQLVEVRTASGTANNVSIKVRAIDKLWPTYININEIANHPAAYADAATALADVPELYRRKGVKCVYYDDYTQLWIEMLYVDDMGPNGWMDVENNWIIEGPIETKLFSSTGGQQLRIAGEKRSNLDDILNVNVWNDKNFAYDSPALARAAVPILKRKLGVIITYLLDDGWVTEQFISDDVDDRINNWEVSTNWRRIGQTELDQLADDVKDTTEKPTAQSLSELNARITALEAILTNKIKDRIDVTKEFNVWGKTNLILYGDGANTKAPDFIGQKYIDTTNSNVYVAVGTTNAGNWKLV